MTEANAEQWASFVLLVFEVAGLVAFAASGALLAAEKRMDLVGMIGLAILTGTGGGAVRDMLIGNTTVTALVNWWMLLTAAATGFVVFLLFKLVRRLHRAMLVFDSIGLGIFVVSGTLTASAFGVNLVGAAAVGLLSGVGGGVLRDLTAMDVPVVFRRDSKLYLVPGLVGSSITAILVALGAATWWSTVLVIVAVVAVRMASEFWGWRMPSVKTQVMNTIEEPRRPRRPRDRKG